MYYHQLNQASPISYLCYSMERFVTLSKFPLGRLAASSKADILQAQQPKTRRLSCSKNKYQQSVIVLYIYIYIHMCIYVYICLRNIYIIYVLNIIYACGLYISYIYIYIYIYILYIYLQNIYVLYIW